LHSLPMCSGNDQFLWEFEDTKGAIILSVI
jgi:hypothetical protein